MGALVSIAGWARCCAQTVGRAPCDRQRLIARMRDGIEARNVRHRLSASQARGKDVLISTKKNTHTASSWARRRLAGRAGEE